MNNKFHWWIDTPQVQFITELPVNEGDRLIIIHWDNSIRAFVQTTRVAIKDGADFFKQRNHETEFVQTNIRNFDVFFQCHTKEQEHPKYSEFKKKYPFKHSKP